MQQPPSSFSVFLPLVFQGGLELKESILLMANGGLNVAHPILHFKNHEAQM